MPFEATLIRGTKISSTILTPEKEITVPSTAVYEEAFAVRVLEQQPSNLALIRIKTQSGDRDIRQASASVAIDRLMSSTFWRATRDEVFDSLSYPDVPVSLGRLIVEWTNQSTFDE